MGHLYFLLGLGALVLLAFAFSVYKATARRYRLPYAADPALFAPAQLAFLAALERAVGRGYRVYGRVRAADVIGLRRRLDPRTRRRAWERLGERRFDFLVCDARTSAIACAVNLARRSRLRRRIPRDALDRICAAAGLPFVRFRESDAYSVVEIEERVLAAIESRPKPVPQSARTLKSAPPDPLESDLDDLGGTLIAEDRRIARGQLRVPYRQPAAAGAGASGAVANGAVGQGAAPAATRPIARSTGQAAPAHPALPASRPVPGRQPGPPPAAPPRSEPILPEPIRPDPIRLEPRLVAAGDIDLGPSFRIDGDLEDEDRPPARRGRG